MIEDITIVTLVERKALPSKHKEGETYNLVKVVDSQNRQLSTFGAWADGWKMGDVVKGIVEPNDWTDRNGNKQIGFIIKNPNAKTFSKGGFAPTPSTIQFQAYSIAATLIPYLIDGKKVTLASVDKLASAIKKRLEVAKPATPTTPGPTAVVPTVGIDTPATPATPPATEGATEAFVFDESDPFGEKETEF